jgi:nicotinamide mononucleotide (NMN) deamidase PncC
LEIGEALNLYENFSAVSNQLDAIRQANGLVWLDLAKANNKHKTYFYTLFRRTQVRNSLAIRALHRLADVLGYNVTISLTKKR